MKKIIQSLSIVVVFAGVGIWIYHIVEDLKLRKDPEPPATTAQKISPDELPISEEVVAQDRALLEKTFKTPEALDAAEVVTSSTASAPPIERPTLMSEIDFPEKAPKPPVDTKKLPYFHAGFASLRTDAVRNPDSEQNQKTVTRLMQMRQQRLQREENKTQSHIEN